MEVYCWARRLCLSFFKKLRQHQKLLNSASDKTTSAFHKINNPFCQRIIYSEISQKIADIPFSSFLVWSIIQGLYNVFIRKCKLTYFTSLITTTLQSGLQPRSCVLILLMSDDAERQILQDFSRQFTYRHTYSNTYIQYRMVAAFQSYFIHPFNFQSG